MLEVSDVALTGPVDLLFLLCFIATRICVVVGVMLVVCFPIYVSACFVCFMFDSAGELFVECVCYPCG